MQKEMTDQEILDHVSNLSDLEKTFKRYIKRVYQGKKLPKRQLKELRNIFYYSAGLYIDLVNKAAHINDPVKFDASVQIMLQIPSQVDNYVGESLRERLKNDVPN